MIVHKIVVWLNGFRTRPNVRRSAWIGKECIVPKSCIVGERVKLKHRVVWERIVLLTTTFTQVD